MESESGQEWALRERLKELDTIREVSLRCHRATSRQELLDTVVPLIPRGWQYVDHAAALATVGALEVRTPGYIDTEWVQEEVLHLDGVAVGRVAVAYLRAFDASDEGPFLAEERQLPRSIALELESAMQRIAYEERIQYFAEHDAETRLLSRRGASLAIFDRVKREPDRPYGYFVLDLARVWEVNRLMGLEAGTALVREVARRLRGRFDGIVAREWRRFVFTVDDLTTEDLLPYLRDQIAPLLEEPFEVNDGASQVIIDFSIAAAHYPDHDRDPIAVSTLADSALGRAGVGHRRLVIADPARDGPSAFELGTLTDIRAAAAAGEFVLLYQPRVNRHAEIECVEALIRWDRGGRLVPPGEFLDVAEQHGLVRDVITPFVCFRAFNQVATSAAHGREVRVAVNLSPSALLAEECVELLATTIRLAGIRPDLVEIEVTESGVLADLERARATLVALRELGISVALDDFGTGYSSLSLLRDLPIDVVKIDRAFVRDVLASPTDAAIVRSTVAMAKAIGAVIVAEGVEDQPTAEWLIGEGVDSLQGYHFARPLVAEDIPSWRHHR